MWESSPAFGEAPDRALIRNAALSKRGYGQSARGRLNASLASLVSASRQPLRH